LFETDSPASHLFIQQRIQANLKMNFRHLMILLLEPLASPEEVAEYEVDEAVAEHELTARNKIVLKAMLMYRLVSLCSYLPE
jgi:hypothetical protein